ncbi:MAG: hypothetical protein EXR71_13350 [Myxococcales bacterium]|nr:hypothetical protein [Myxococcales bacterium]
MLLLLSLGVLALFFIAGGVNHFVHPKFYLSMMPDYLRAHLLLVNASGVFEVLGGIGILVPFIRYYAGLGLIALLVAVFPANLNMALHPERFPGVPLWGLYLRLPLQVVMIGWVWWATRRLG